jgi:predicted kinase
MLALGHCDEIISRDDLRASLFNGEGILSNVEESRVTEVQKSIVKDALRAGKHIVVHDLNLRERYRRAWATVARNFGAEFEIVDLTRITSLECMSNIEMRVLEGGRHVPANVVQKLHDKFIAPLKGKLVPYPDVAIEPVTFEPYVPRPGRPDAIIVDIDGTIADHTGVRSPYDSTKYRLDKPKEKVIKFVQDQHYNLGKQIIFCSGRFGSFPNKTATEDWLFDHVKVPFRLVMREDAERDDSVEKYLLFDKYIRPYYNVLFVLDDRDRVVKMWRQIGLLTFQVADGDF